MLIDRTVAPLLRVPLFCGLKPLQITEIARKAERIAFRDGRIMIEAGEPGDCAYLIVSGAARCLDDAGAPAAIEAGSLIGELAMLIEHEYTSTVIAHGRVQALRITRAALHEQMRSDPTLAEHLSEQIRSRIQKVAQELRRIDAMLASRETDAEDSAQADSTPIATEGLRSGVTRAASGSSTR